MPTRLHRRRLHITGAAHLLFFCATSLAQTPAWQHQSWSTDAGLPQSSVHQILQSRDGYLWLATEGGVVRYDGVVFTVFNHATDPNFTSDDVTALAQDRADNLWFATADGLIERTHGRTRRFAEPEGLPSASVLALNINASGHLIVATTAGIATYDGSNFQTVADDSGDTFHGSAKTPDGVVWSWDTHKIVANSAASSQLWSVGKQLPGARIQSVLLDRLGTAWVGTNRGLVAVTSSSPRVAPVTALGVSSVLALLQDAEGNLWIGTETSGLHVLRPRKFRPQTGLADEEISAVVQAADGAFWLGTREDGLRRIAGEVVAHPVANNALTSPIILSLAPGQHGDVWAGTPDGLNHVEPNGSATHFTSSDGLPDDLIRSLLTAHDGTLWVGTRQGLAHLRNGRFETLTQTSGLGDNLVGALFQTSKPDADLWIGTLAGVTRIHDGALTNFTAANGLLTHLVTAFAQDAQGRLWIASRDHGLFLFDGRRFIAIAANTLAPEIDSLIADGRGDLWLRGARGVLRASTQDLSACATLPACHPNIATYGTEDGMPSEELVANGEPAAWATTTGELWFATRKGVAITTPASLAVNTIPPPIVIEHLTADNDAIPTDLGAQTIASGHSRYTFEFAALSFTLPSKVIYRYQLEGFDHDWSEPGTRRNASYTNLPPGPYTFRVQAANNDGVWNDIGASLHFRILPPVYRRWWFLLLVALLLALIVWLLYRLRVRTLQKNFDAVLAERNRIAREIHDTLAQDFVGVSLQLDLVTQMLKREEIPEAAQQVKNTRAYVQSGLEEARQSIWNLRANTAADSLPTRVTALVKRVSTESLRIAVKIGGSYRSLPATLEDEVLRILQESLTNIERHAHATAASVQLTYREDKLILTVDDNGRGFSVEEATQRSGHFGLQGMNERAATLGAELELHSSPSDGTRLRLTVPIAGRKGRPA